MLFGCRSVNVVNKSCTDGVTTRTPVKCKIKTVRDSKEPSAASAPSTCPSYDKLYRSLAWDNSISPCLRAGWWTDEVDGVVITNRGGAIPKTWHTILVQRYLNDSSKLGREEGVSVASMYCKNSCHWTAWQPYFHPSNRGLFLDWPKHAVVQRVQWHTNMCQIAWQADWLCCLWFLGLPYAKSRKQ